MRTRTRAESHDKTRSLMPLVVWSAEGADQMARRPGGWHVDARKRSQERSWCGHRRFLPHPPGRRRFAVRHPQGHVQDAQQAGLGGGGRAESFGLTRMSSHPPTRAYVERRSKEGLSKKEIIRCLKRYVAREVYPSLRAPGG